MAKEFENEIEEMIEADVLKGDAPLFLGELTREGRITVIEYILNKMEATGVDPRADYEELNDDEDDDEDDWDDEDDNDDFHGSEDEDDRWPGDTDEDE